MSQENSIISFQLPSLTDWDMQDWDTIIDVRAPIEFAEDHLPGAINLPVLSDVERVQVGTIYKQQSPFTARKIGGALVAQNTARHLQEALSDKPGDWRPLIYCWRGGQRSNAFATILSQVGWRAGVLEGGYRSYRKEVADLLYGPKLPHRIMLLDGGTGTAKTSILQKLAHLGAQVLDLEAVAGHRGSLFGATRSGQPSQKMFESHLAAQITRLDPNTPTWIEAESSKIGARLIPPALWSVMQSSTRIRIKAPLQARSTYLCEAYKDLLSNPSTLLETLDQLRPFHAAETIKAWQALAHDRAWPTLAASLIERHYDPRYTKSKHSQAAPLCELSLADLSPEALAQAAESLLSHIKQPTHDPSPTLDDQ